MGASDLGESLSLLRVTGQSHEREPEQSQGHAIVGHGIDRESNPTVIEVTIGSEPEANVLPRCASTHCIAAEELAEKGYIRAAQRVRDRKRARRTSSGKSPRVGC